MKRYLLVLPLVLLLAYATTGNIYCGEPPAYQPLAAQAFHCEV